jgi:V/A-type H+-transporting ATPase subunit D
MNVQKRLPTRAAVLELQSEQRVVNEAYTFLDEKRMLLAAELLRQLRLYQELNDSLSAQHLLAQRAMQAAVMHHGLNGLQVSPVAAFHAGKLRQKLRNFMGVTLVDSELLTDNEGPSHPPAAVTSGYVEKVRKLLSEILVQSAVLAGMSGNLYRLLNEYRITERRSRALENVILPEIEQELREMSSHLEELDLEDAIRTHQR